MAVEGPSVVARSSPSTSTVPAPRLRALGARSTLASGPAQRAARRRGSARAARPRPPRPPAAAAPGRPNGATSTSRRAPRRSCDQTPAIRPSQKQHGREPALRAVDRGRARAAAQHRVLAAGRADDVLVEGREEPHDAGRRGRGRLGDVAGQHPAARAPPPRPPPVAERASQRPASAGDVMPNQRWNCSRGAGP